MLKKDERAICSAVCEEREYGYNICDFDDERHDLRAIAEVIDVEMHYDEDEKEFIFKNKKDEARVKETLNFYYKLH